jgi:3-oxoadipate enol-lactonase
MRCLDLDGIFTHYQVSGDPRKPPLVLVNSLGSDFRIWDALVPAFSDRYYLVRYDKRGHGLSSCPPGPYELADFSRDLSTLADRLELASFLLVGISVGGQIAMRFALDHPDKVRALVLSNTAAKIGTPAYWQDRIRRIREVGMEAMTAEILLRWFSEDYQHRHPADHAGYRHMLSRMPESGYIATCQALAGADLREEVRNLNVKTLVMTGSEDAGITPVIARELAAALSEAVFKEIPAAGHHPCIENPEVVLEAMLTFFQEQANE